MRKVCLIFVLALIESTWQAQWTYDDESQWPGACSFGRQQSPINIISASSAKDYDYSFIKSPLQFRGYERVPLSGRNNGHTLQWKASPGSSATLSGGPLDEEYKLVQIHLHWISEHAIDGVKFPMEIHLVHIKSSLIEATANIPDSYAVIGIPVEIREAGPEGDPFEELMRDVPFIVNNSVILPPRDIDVSKLLSPDPQSFYTYRGSLTTPTCGESVIWIVNDRPTFISGQKYKYITQTKIGSTTNFRALQPLNRRLVWKTVNSSSALQPTFLGVIGSLINCTGHILDKGMSYFSDLKRRLLNQRVDSP